MEGQYKKFGTAPVFFTAISTIFGAILFLRFGYAVGTVGFLGVLLIIVLGHMITIPTALSISEIATNKRVEGGGEYYIISRSFGLNIGATIGTALYLSQAISVAFYVIAFTESFQFLFDFIRDEYALIIPRQAISVPVMILLTGLILRKGANLGVQALYVIVTILGISLLLFFLGDRQPTDAGSVAVIDNFEFRNADSFFLVFAIVFPAFTGMTAGVGLSGDLKNPSRSIPVGTIFATLLGLVVYIFISYKLSVSSSEAELTGDQFVMSKITVWGWFFIPLGLAASTISSALGSYMVAPRTLQALAGDNSFPVPGLNKWFSHARKKDHEPMNASIFTAAIALLFVAIGNVNIVARIISMFFLITYGTLCLISFLNHFGSSPSYRPSFRSRWYISLLGFVTSVWIMFQIDAFYSLLAFSLMILMYIYINNFHKDRRGIASIFANAIFQLNHKLQLYLQKTAGVKFSGDWRPSAICISKDSFIRENAFKLTNWISYKYGFGTYLHRIEGYYSKNAFKQAKEELNRLIHDYGDASHVFIDTIISPSYTSAIANSIQIPSISGMDNNMVIFEYDKANPEGLAEIIDNYKLVISGKFDICILASSRKPIIYKNGIHVWITTSDADNANLMIILSFIILGHPDWKKSSIKIFDICKKNELEDVKKQMDELIEKGRLPITSQNINILIEEEGMSYKSIINQHSAEAALCIIGFRSDHLRKLETHIFEGYEDLGNILFVNSFKSKSID